MGEQSPAYKLMQAAIRASELTAWIDINRSRRALLFWMIEARIPFEADDIGVFCHRFNGGHWFPLENDELLTEACAHKNKSAIASVSAYLGRPVWRWEPGPRDDVPSKVLHVGATVWLDDVPHRVTSFGEKGLTLIACSYHPHEAGKPPKIKTRRVFTFDELAAIRKSRLDAQKDQKATRKAAQATAEEVNNGG
jgi:hypothetical protein